jgi:hypothetical protein
VIAGSKSAVGMVAYVFAFLCVTFAREGSVHSASSSAVIYSPNKYLITRSFTISS